MTLTPQMQAALKAEITTDPAGRGYAGKTAQEQADLVNAAFSVARQPVTVDVPVGDVEGYFRSRFIMGTLEKFIASPPAGAPPQLVDGIGELLGMIASPHSVTVAMTDPVVAGAVAAVLAGAVQAGLMTAQNEADLLAMAKSTPPPLELHARVMDVFMGMAGAPNEVTADDVTGALA